MRQHVSYKDICTGVNGRNASREEDDESLNYAGFEMDEESDEDKAESLTEEKDVDPPCPVIKVTKKELQEARKPWRLAVIVKLLVKSLGLGFMRARPVIIWQPTGNLEVIDLAHGFFVVRFSNVVDYQHVFDGGPWVILGHWLVVQQWKREFIPSEGELGKWLFGFGFHTFQLSFTGKPSCSASGSL